MQMNDMSYNESTQRLNSARLQFPNSCLYKSITPVLNLPLTYYVPILRKYSLLDLFGFWFIVFRNLV